MVAKTAGIPEKYKDHPSKNVGFLGGMVILII